MRSLIIKIALAWVVLASLSRLDDAINDGLPSAPVSRLKDHHHAYPIITMTTLLGSFGLLLTREIRGEERADRAGGPRKPARIAWRLATLRLGWSGGFIIAMMFAWAMQVGIFVKASTLPGWRGRPALLGLLGAVLVAYAVLTFVWGKRYLRALGHRHASSKAKPPRVAGVWDPELDHGFAHGLRPVS